MVNGDYSQEVSYPEDLTDAFHAIVEKLQEREIQLKEEEERRRKEEEEAAANNGASSNPNASGGFGGVTWAGNSTGGWTVSIPAGLCLGLPIFPTNLAEPGTTEAWTLQDPLAPQL